MGMGRPRVCHVAFGSSCEKSRHFPETAVCGFEGRNTKGPSSGPEPPLEPSSGRGGSPGPSGHDKGRVERGQVALGSLDLPGLLWQPRPLPPLSWGQGRPGWCRAHTPAYTMLYTWSQQAWALTPPTERPCGDCGAFRWGRVLSRVHGTCPHCPRPALAGSLPGRWSSRQIGPRGEHLARLSY